MSATVTPPHVPDGTPVHASPARGARSTAARRVHA
jgi:hypothetical protein